MFPKASISHHASNKILPSVPEYKANYILLVCVILLKLAYIKDQREYNLSYFDAILIYIR